MQITFRGRVYGYDERQITLAQAYVIKANTGQTLKGWQEQVADLDPHAIAHLWWIILAQNGEMRNVADLGELPLLQLLEAIGEAAEAEEKAQAERAGQGGPVGPTVPGASDPIPASTAISPSCGDVISSPSPISPTWGPETSTPSPSPTS